MAGGRIKGITIEIGGDTTKLQTALKGVNTEIRNTQQQLRDVEKLLKLDPGNVQLLAQKQKLLKDAVSETKEKLETLKTAAEQANEALANGDISQEQYDALQREIIETENELRRLEEQANQSSVAVQKIAETGEKMKKAGESMSNAGQKLLPVTGVITGLGTAAVKTAADFDSSMSKVAAVSGATGSDLDDLSDKAREMGAKTKFSASEAAEAMNYMAMAGWKTKDMLGGIEGVMNLAAASGEDLATTSDIVTDALTAFGLKAEDSGHFADILAAASSNANTDVSMMGETFKYVAPIAGALGFSVEDTAEAIGLMANAGIKSSQAGTSLRAIMNNLTGEVKICGEAIGTVSVATTNADGSMRDLSDILIDCRAAFAGLSESEKAQTAEALVGKNAMSGFLALMNAAPEDIEKLSGAIDNCDGKAADMAATMQDNLAGQLQILKSQLEELAISFGELLMPAIRGIVSHIQNFVSWLNSLNEGTRKVIITIALVTAALGPVLIVVGKTVSAIGSVLTMAPKIVGAVNAVKGGITALYGVLTANPIGLVIAAVVALVAAFAYLWNNCEGFRQFWVDLWNGIRDVTVACWAALSSFLTQAWTGIRDIASSSWGSFVGFFSSLWGSIQGTFSSSISIISGVLSTAWAAIQAEAITCWTAIVEFIRTIWTAIKTVITSTVGAVSSFLTGAWNEIRKVVTTVMDTILMVITTAWNAVKSLTITVMNGIRSVITTVWNAIKSVIVLMMTGIQSSVTAGWNKVKSVVSVAVDAIRTAVTNAFQAIANGVKTKVNDIYSAIKSGFDKAVSFIKGLASSAFSWGADIINGIVNGIRSAIGGVKDAVGNVAETIRSYLHFSVPDVGPLTDYESWMPDFMKGLAKGIEDSRKYVVDAMDSIASEMVIRPSVEISQSAAYTSRSGIVPAAATAVSQTELSNLVDVVRNTMAGMGAGVAGDIVIPVYLGGTLLDEVIVSANQRANLRSGGR